MPPCSGAVGCVRAGAPDVSAGPCDSPVVASDQSSKPGRPRTLVLAGCTDVESAGPPSVPEPGCACAMKPAFRTSRSLSRTYAVKGSASLINSDGAPIACDRSSR